VYSLGAILYELLTGRPPFKAETPLRTLLEVVHREPARPRALHPHVHRDLETICLKCLHKDPARRYASAAELADDLERYLEGKPIQARPVGRLERGLRWCGRNWPLALAGGMAVAFLVSAAAAFTVFLLYLAWSQDQIRQKQADIEEKERQRAAALEQLKEQKRQAEQKAVEAQENFRQAFQAVQDFMRVSGVLGKVPGAQPVQRELLTAVLKYLQEFVKQHGDDPNLRSELAEAYFGAGRTFSTLGKKTEAGEHYRHALALYQELGRDRPDDIRLQSQVINTLNNIGIIEGDLGHSAAAREAVQQALHLCEQVIRDHPGTPELPTLLDDLANVNHHLANRLREAGDFDQAFERFGLSRGIMEQLVCANPAQTRFQSELALVIENTGVLHTKLNQNNEGLRAFAEAAAIRERILDARPRDSGAQIALASSYRDLGITHKQLAHPQEALAFLEKAKDAREKAAADNPGVTQYQSDLAASLNDLGGVYYDTKQFAPAIQCYNRAIKIQEKLANLDSNVKYPRADLASSHYRAGLVLAAHRQREDALVAFGRARDLQQKLVGEDPDNYEYHSALANTLHNLGMNLYELKRYGEALPYVQQAVAQQRAALERAPRIDGYRRSLSKHLGLLAELARVLGRPDEAAAALLERRALWAGNGPELYQVAADLAATAAAVAKDKTELSAEEAAQRRRCEDAAVETLRQAVAAGYRDADALQKDPRLAALRGRHDFQALLAGLQK
jgi:tetratricopeptide (TPR) repeat protein